MRLGVRAGAALVVLLGLSAATPASAFCRTNSCDPARGEICSRDASLCLKGGLPLFRASSCVSFAVQKDGSEKNAIDAVQFEAVITKAFETWTSVDCGGGTRPSINVESLGQVECDQPEYNKNAANANIYMFRDTSWMAEGAEYALGLTTVSYYPKTGEIYDVDVEVNGSGGDIKNSANPLEGIDLVSIITHETGHFLGLDHAQTVRSAVMYPSYRAGRDNLRVLDPDDIAGICAIYPPARATPITSCGPRGGFSSTCDPPAPDDGGCAVSGKRSAAPGLTPTLLGVAAASLLRRRRRPRT